MAHVYARSAKPAWRSVQKSASPAYPGLGQRAAMRAAMSSALSRKRSSPVIK
jgi:hypothetical protein